MSEHFKVGTKVAVCLYSNWGPRSISKREVYKVRKDGKFFVSYQGVCSDTMWTPNKHGSPEATRSGCKSGWSRERIEPWTEKHDEELAARRIIRLAEELKNDVLKAISNLQVHNEADRALLERFAALVPAKEEQSNG